MSRLAENFLSFSGKTSSLQSPAFRLSTVRCGVVWENVEKMVGDPLGFTNSVARSE